MNELGRNEELILLSVWKLGDNAYGVTIRNHCREVTGRALNYGSLYNTLYLLVRKGLIASRESDPVSKKGGRRRILYSITPAGLDALSLAQKEHRRVWGDVPDLIGEAKK